MKISTVICEQIDSNARSRGKMYSDWGYAKIISTNKKSIEASVSGSNYHSYHVSIAIQPDEVTVNCSCPSFETHGACKHIWATILTAEKNGFESDILDNDAILIENNIHEDDSALEEAFLNELENSSLDQLTDHINKLSKETVKRTGYKNVYQFTTKGSSTKKRPSNWKSLFAATSNSDHSYSQKNDFIGRRIFYEIECADTVGLHGLYVNIKTRRVKKNGDLGQPIDFELIPDNISQIEDETDRQILSMILGTNSFSYPRYSSNTLNNTLADLVFPRMLETGKCFLSSPISEDSLLLHYDKSTKWEFTLSLEKSKSGYQINPSFICGSESRNIKDALYINSIGYVFWGDGTVNHLDAHKLYSWIKNFLKETYIIPISEAHHFIVNFHELEDKPKFTYPDDLNVPEICIEPQPLLKIHGVSDWRTTLMMAELNFLYDQHVFRFGQSNKSIFDSDQNKLYSVNYTYHKKCIDLLHELGVKEDTYNSFDYLLNFRKSRFVPIISSLINHGWRVEGKDLQFKKPGNFSISVNSGIDWFEVNGTCDYDGETVSIPEILEALRKKKEFIELSGGKLGILPTEWLSKYGRLASMGETEDETIRFKKSQTLLVDLLLADQPAVNCDEIFKSIRTSLHNFTGITPENESEKFCGQLRNYQREGMGWLAFLNQFGFGGCLADDMGLGKTIQVLAFLQKQSITSPASLKKPNSSKKRSEPVKVPSLVVTPRSLIYNWFNEASKFTPDLKVLDYSHSQRATTKVDFSEYDLILATYGTLIRDIESLSNFHFNYVILDEAQAIKNANTVASKAVRLLNGNNRLALSGTPVENHLSDLWSIFEFLNPGILGTASVFKGAKKDNSPDEIECELLRKVLRPFILRRTKSQVAVDLPVKSEELIICEMEPLQRKQYDQLKEYYKSSLQKKIKQSGLNRSKIHILEALLRLRQSACHPGLIDNNLSCITSAKLDTLIAQLTELKEEGHKSLVFSQFTSMLAIIRDKLDESRIKYEYLDGSTRNRQEVVDRFQNEPDCNTFLISLKAGGVGLNLTAAEYVFIFDPWWNPAAEMQAIDRTHRIGQTKPVFAYKLICKDTVEEKIIELQKSKRFLAESVITTDESVLSSITSEELELLLS
ncbi:MAG TPA: DEAD/DEAH box helicase [Chitinispirillaceae bacterium]|nr:DEAD/DEAH box helicase [Chitinispirillaceae bacterium]